MGFITFVGVFYSRTYITLITSLKLLNGRIIYFSKVKITDNYKRWTPSNVGQIKKKVNFRPHHNLEAAPKAKCHFHNRGFLKYKDKGYDYLDPVDSCVNQNCINTECPERHQHSCKIKDKCKFLKKSKCEYIHKSNAIF